jgi:hypothetical protein
MPWLLRRTLVRPFECVHPQSLPQPLSLALRRCFTLFWATLTSHSRFLFLSLGLGCSVLHAQSNAPGVSPQPSRQPLGTFDRDIAIPDATQPLGQKDSGALTELTGNLVAAGSSSWTSLTGTGQITYGAANSSAYSATLSILGEAEFRLDAQTSTGPLSIRISGSRGSIQEADGRRFPIPPDTAATGIFQFVQPRRANLPSLKQSLLDRGPATVDGASLRRVTLAFAAKNRDIATGKPANIATDLYFDPSSHLLVKSANFIGVDGGHNNHFLRVVTYEDYRQVGNSMIPFRFTQTLDGQKQWTLQLTEVQLNPTFPPTYFEF